MVRRHPHTRFLFITLQVIAVAIICLGSLINFHQYKIWGKPLIPTFIGYKRDVEKYAKLPSYSKTSHDDHSSFRYFSSSDGLMTSGTIGANLAHGSFITADLPCFVPDATGQCSCGLRAPPTV